VGLGTDVAGGYSVDVMNSMRQSVTVSRMRQGSQLIAKDKLNETDNESARESLAITWKEALYLATRGGMLALDIPSCSGVFEVGKSFDAQCSTCCSFVILCDFYPQ
jgi:guanine deaminase